MVEQRKVVLVTSLGKKYLGKVDIPRSSMRTTDLFNSSSIYWREPGDKCFENAIQLYDVHLVIDDSPVRVRFDKIQVRLSEVVYFYDDQQIITDSKEKMRASTMVQKTKEQVQTVNIITTRVANSFYNLTGSFFGLFKKKSNDKFIPLTEVKIIEIYSKEGKWFQREIDLPFKFICISTNHIEAVRLQ